MKDDENSSIIQIRANIEELSLLIFIISDRISIKKILLVGQ